MAEVYGAVQKNKISTGSSIIAIRLCTLSNEKQVIIRFNAIRIHGGNATSVTIAFAKHESANNVLNGSILGNKISGVAFYKDEDSIYAYMPSHYFIVLLELLAGALDYELLTEFDTANYTEITLNT